jgi:hypothetical protein
MAFEHQNIYRQVYNVREDEQLLAGLHHVTCVFARRAVLAIGYDGNNELLSLHYAAYGKERPVWELDFFEQLFHQEPLLLKHDKITKVFVLTSSEMIVPETLYDKGAAEQWFNTIHFVEPNDVIAHYPLSARKANYIYSIPHGINELIRISCHSAKVRPLAACQLDETTPVQCILTSEQACVTLYNNGKLLWHKIFDYAQPEDVAYEIKLVCKEHNINSDKLGIACSSMSTAEYTVVNGLSQYFGGITGGDGQYIKSLWGPTLSLVKQMETCA